MFQKARRIEQKSIQPKLHWPGGCTVNIASAYSNQGNSTQIASLSPAACAPNQITLLNIPNLGSSRLSTSFLSPIIFTPRSTRISDAQSPVSEIKFLISGSSLLRCIRISGLAGVIEIGSRGSGSTLADLCSDYTRICYQ